MSSAEEFEAIVSEHYEPLFKFAMCLKRMESDAQDLTQEVFRVWAAKGHQSKSGDKSPCTNALAIFAVVGAYRMMNALRHFAGSFVPFTAGNNSARYKSYTVQREICLRG